MIKEYSYKNNIFMQILISLWMLFLTYLYISSVISFIGRSDVFNLGLYTIFMAGFIYFFWYLLKIYFLKKPVLILMETSIKHQGLLGIKEIPFIEIEKLELKVTASQIYILIISEKNPPISVKLNRIEGNPDDSFDLINKYYQEKRKS